MQNILQTINLKSNSSSRVAFSSIHVIMNQPKWLVVQTKSEVCTYFHWHSRFDHVMVAVMGSSWLNLNWFGFIWRGVFRFSLVKLNLLVFFFHTCIIIFFFIFSYIFYFIHLSKSNFQQWLFWMHWRGAHHCMGATEMI